MNERKHDEHENFEKKVDVFHINFIFEWYSS